MAVGAMSADGTEVVRFGEVDYEVTVRPLKGRSKRRDVEVVSNVPESRAIADVTPALRKFFADVDDELRRRRDDPVALTNGLARLDAIAADVRYVRSTAHDLLAEALRDQQIRTLTVSRVATVEGTGSIDRQNWNHVKLLRDLIDKLGWRVADANGEWLTTNQVVTALLLTLRPEWKLTGLRETGIEPNDYCDLERDDRGQPVSTPSVKMVDNRIRRQTAPPSTQGRAP